VNVREIMLGERENCIVGEDNNINNNNKYKYKIKIIKDEISKGDFHVKRQSIQNCNYP